MDLKLRRVDIDFSDAKIHWNPAGPEFSHLFNAFSVLAPHLEPFLIKVMRQFRERLPDSAEPLKADIDLFNGQEGRHYRMHMKFNKVLYAAGYDMAEEEAKLKADYERFLDDKGLKFCLAYSEGFETLGPALSGFFFDRQPELMRQWDEMTTYLWLWHVAEEYEHRAVVNSTWKIMYGGYWYRIYGLWYALIHIFGFVLRNANRMTNHDLAHGRIRGKLRSRLRLARSLGGLFAYAVPRLLVNAQRPSYDPTKLPPMEGAMALLDDVSRRYGILEPH
ncbi:MAG: metal-dependent hydrolase [Acidimicrobiia bacterium]